MLTNNRGVYMLRQVSETDMLRQVTRQLIEVYIC